MTRYDNWPLAQLQSNKGVTACVLIKFTYEYKILLVETKFNLCVIYLCK